MAFARSLRKGDIQKEPAVSKKNGNFVLVLDDVYDTFNVGGMYRVSDAAGVTKIYHCGQTPVPPDPKIVRASVGLVNYLPWEYQNDVVELVTRLHVSGYKIVVLEQDEKSITIDELSMRAKHALPLQQNVALISGNETFGVKKEVIDLADIVVELPMYGINKSLNVVVSTGIILYEIRRILQSTKT
jgi:23S rRNA (guanosine2251-2'-O)-methyltransferase